MHKIIPSRESKLTKIVSQITQNNTTEKPGFLNNSNNKSAYFKSKSFRLRQLDFVNLNNVVREINNISERKNYSDSEVIRGLINFTSDNIKSNLKKILEYVKDSS